ncbi:HEAT repeat domain-containing protein [Sphingomonas sp. 1P06PA]|uniref:HEAT repeat domain-containing protein n=1 Tax=Sphingomonas sp. 1P06PA TaxID=554121 RepID=UPI0039A4704C
MTGDAVAAAFRALPAVAAFEAALVRAEETPPAIEAAVRALLGDRGWIDSAIGILIAAARADPWFEPPFAAIGDDAHRGLLLIEDRRATISLSWISGAALGARKRAAAGAGSIGFSGQRTIYRLISGAAELDLWRAPPIDAGFDAATRGPATRAGRRTISAGETFEIDGRCESFSIAGANGDLVLAQGAVHAGAAAIACEHDPATGVLIAASATDPAASHAEMMATLLAAMRRADAVSALAKLAAHPAFFLRWHAARMLHRIDAAAARPLIAAMAAHDPHRDVRAAAAGALRRMPATDTCPA